MGMGMPEINISGANANSLVAVFRARGSARTYYPDGFYTPVMIRLKTGPEGIPDLDDARPQRIECEMPVEVMLENISGQAMLPKLHPQSPS